MTANAQRAPRIMGIVNVTPDSFSDGGQFLDQAAAIEHGRRLADDGASILDIGGESTRPGAEPTRLEDELRRVMPVIEGLAGSVGASLSIDTRKPEVARAAIEAGAVLWNDVSALTFSPHSLDAAAALSCHIVLMHAQGAPKSMQNNPVYDDVVEEVAAFLRARVEACLKAGIDQNRLMVDPGIGFGKTLAHNLALLRNVGRFADIAPVLIGASRKRFIPALDKLAGAENPATARLGGSIAAAIAAARRGAAIIRVHDVAQTRQALLIAHAIDG